MRLESPYPELKKTRAMACNGCPWIDTKSPAAVSVWSVNQGLGSCFVLRSGRLDKARFPNL